MTSLYSRSLGVGLLIGCALPAVVLARPAATALSPTAEASPAPRQTDPHFALGAFPFAFQPSATGAGFEAVGLGASVTVNARGATLVRGQAHLTSRTGPRPVRRSPELLQIRLLGADTSAPARREQPQGVASDFRGRDRRYWKSRVPLYGQIRYREVYPGIDVVYHGADVTSHGELEYDFVVAPHRSPEVIRLAFSDGSGRTLRPRIDATGELVVPTPGAELRQSPPVLYQEIDGRRVLVSGRFRLLPAQGADSANTAVGFEVGAYDRTRPLTIDPTLRYFTQPGAICSDVAVDAQGFPYVVGSAYAQVGDENLFALDGFVRKFSADGSRVLYTTRFGGEGTDFATGLAVDAGGRAYITGMTDSPDFPTANPLQGELGGGQLPEGFPHSDAFVLKLSPGGETIEYATYLGGPHAENIFDEGAIAVDGDGNIYVSGDTVSPDFPVVNAIQPQKRGEDQEFPELPDAFVCKLNPQGSALLFSTYLGGSEWDGASGIAVGPGGSVAVCGWTHSLDFPVRNAAQPDTNDLNDRADAWIARFSPDGTELLYSTLLGGTHYDYAWDVAVDTSGAAYVTGFTVSTNFPLAQPFQEQLNGGSELPNTVLSPFEDAFVTKVSPDGGQFVYSTLLGGSLGDAAFSIAVEAGGAAVVAGVTASYDFPTLDSAPRSPNRTDSDGFVARLRPDGSGLESSSYLGGPGTEDLVLGLALDAAGNQFAGGLSEPPQRDEGPFATAARRLRPVRRLARRTATVGIQSAPIPSERARAYVSRLRKVTRRGAGRLVLSAPRLAFRTIPGEAQRLSLRLLNGGTGPLAGSVGEARAPFQVVSGAGAFQLEPGQGHEVVVEFTPGTRPLVRGSLPLTTTSPRRGRRAVSLQGRVVRDPGAF